MFRYIAQNRTENHLTILILLFQTIASILDLTKPIATLDKCRCRTHLSDSRDRRRLFHGGDEYVAPTYIFHVVFPRDFHVLVSVGFEWNRERSTSPRRKERKREREKRREGRKERHMRVEPRRRSSSLIGVRRRLTLGDEIPGYRPLQAPTLFFVTDCMLRSIGFSIEDMLAKTD